MYVHSLNITFEEMVALRMPDPREQLYGLLMRTPLFAGTNAAGDAPGTP
jgi:hypothetical protein